MVVQGREEFPLYISSSNSIILQEYLENPVFKLKARLNKFELKFKRLIFHLLSSICNCK